MGRNRNGGGDTTKVSKSQIDTDLLKKKKIDPLLLAERTRRGKLQQAQRAINEDKSLTKEGKQVEADAAARKLGYKFQSANTQNLVNKEQEAKKKGKSAQSIYKKQ